MKLLTRTIIALAATGTLTGALLAGAAPASAADVTTTYISVEPPPGGSIGPKVMDVRGWSKAQRATVQLWQLLRTGNYNNQRWTITKVFTSPEGLGVYELKNVNSKMCLDMSLDAGYGQNGTPVYQYPCARTTNQLWMWVRREPNNDWGYLINYNTATGADSDALCLDATGASYSDGPPLQVWQCNHDNGSNWNQRWNIF